GRFDLGQLFNRPARPWNPYSTSDPHIFICSASTPPGPGVHGMCGYFAARSAIERFGR
ncbi:MAG: FAD-dependent oxidoreductase, partial [Candidatus Limnocylindrales bacterium]